MAHAPHTGAENSHSQLNADHDFAHPFPVWGLIAVFFALVFLTIVTVAQASFDLGGWDIILSMIIATIKATLVVLFFMHLAFDKPFNAIIFVASLFFVALFIGGTIADSQTYRDTLEPELQGRAELAQ